MAMRCWQARYDPFNIMTFFGPLFLRKLTSDRHERVLLLWKLFDL